MTQQYLVEWKIDIWASSPEEAALTALKIQRDPNSTALSYEVSDMAGEKETVDLWDTIKRKGGEDGLESQS